MPKASLGLAENQVVIFMVTDGQRVTDSGRCNHMTMGWLAWEECFLHWRRSTRAVPSVDGYRGPYSVSGPAYRAEARWRFDDERILPRMGVVDPAKSLDTLSFAASCS